MKISSCADLCHVEELRDEEIRSEIYQVSKLWSDISRERFSFGGNSMYERALRVNLTVSRWCEKGSSFLRRYSVAFCYGVDLKIRGFALLKLDTFPLYHPKKGGVPPSPDRHKNILRLMYLSKDPANLFGELGYKGVGVRLVNYIIQRYGEQFEAIYVEPLPEVRSFFASFGFVSASLEETGSEKGMIWRPSRV